MMTSILPNLLVQNGDDPAQLITCCNFHIFHKQIFFQLFLQLLSKSSIFVLMNSELQDQLELCLHGLFMFHENSYFHLDIVPN